MNLFTIDYGNSNPHVGIFNQDDLLEVKKLDESIIGKENTIHCSVVKETILPGLDSKEFFKGERFLDMPVHYTNTVGIDRLVLAYLFYNHERTIPTLIIDAGTFTTIDILSDKGFEGGLIIPGVETYLNSFERASKLPVLEKEKMKEATYNFAARSTEEAILNGYVCLLKSMIDEASMNHAPKQVILTGGDSGLLSSHIPQAKTNPHFIHYALKKVFENKDLH